MPNNALDNILKAHAGRWMAIPGVVGVGIGLYQNRPCLTILVSRKTRELKNHIPSAIEGFPVIVKKTGEIRALDRHHRHGEHAVPARHRV